MLFLILVKDVKDTWHNLRIYYMRQRKLATTVKSGDGAENALVPKWIFYKQMEFLSDSCLQRASQSNWIESPPSNVESQVVGGHTVHEIRAHNLSHLIDLF
jgi:hypothetical protein